MRIQPPKAGLDQASGTVHTQRGPVSLDWTRKPHGVVAAVELPVNVTATVALPAAEGWTYRSIGSTKAEPAGTEDGLVLFEVGSGTSRFVPVPERE